MGDILIPQDTGGPRQNQVTNAGTPHGRIRAMSYGTEDGKTYLGGLASQAALAGRRTREEV